MDNSNDVIKSYCSAFNLDVERVTVEYNNELQAFKKRKSHIGELSRLQERWNNSMYDSPDYGVYSDKYYFLDLLLCWKVYTSGYLSNLKNPRSLSTSKSVYSLFDSSGVAVDLGCGLGLSSNALTHMFRKVYGSNLPDCHQYEFCKIQSEENGWNLISNMGDIREPVEVVFGFEYFEHFQDPFAHTVEVLEKLQPRYLCTASAFTSEGIGHFEEYQKCEDISIQMQIGKVDTIKKFDGKKVQRELSRILKTHGYTKVMTKMWNDRPRLWVKK